MAIHSRDVKVERNDRGETVEIDVELWCDSCGTSMPYDRGRIESGELDADLELWRDNGCPECGDRVG